MAMTLRLPDGLLAEVQAYASAVGVPVTGVVAIALRHYLDDRGRRLRLAALEQPPLPDPGSDEAVQARQEHKDVQPRKPRAKPLVVHQEPVSTATSAPAPGDWPAGAKPPKKPRAPCPCGSGAQWRHCHGKEAQGRN
jgi:hypothetical protein